MNDISKEKIKDIYLLLCTHSNVHFSRFWTCRLDSIISLYYKLVITIFFKHQLENLKTTNNYNLLVSIHFLIL